MELLLKEQSLMTLNFVMKGTGLVGNRLAAGRSGRRILLEALNALTYSYYGNRVYFSLLLRHYFYEIWTESRS